VIPSLEEIEERLKINDFFVKDILEKGEVLLMSLVHTLLGLPLMNKNQQEKGSKKGILQRRGTDEECCQDEIRSFVKEVVRQFNPDRVILF